MSRGIEPGDQAPDFELSNANAAVGGGTMTLSDAMGDNGAVVMFTCNHCPYVVGSEERIENAASRARELGMGFVAVSYTHLTLPTT